LQDYPPLALSLFLSSLLFLSHPWGIFKFLSANSDNHAWGYDYFGLPRCGLAILRGIQIAGSEKVIPYGPWATDWASHPAMCFILGIPLSQFSDPRFSYFAANFIYFCIYIYSLFTLTGALCDGSFKKLSASRKSIHYAFSVLIGFYTPYVIIYHYGQYHALSVLALALLLQKRQQLVGGFVLSALTKPFLAPAGLLLVAQKRWKTIGGVLIFTALGTLPWFILDALTGKRSMSTLGDSGLNKLLYTVPNWEQEQSFAKFFETLVSPHTNMLIRLVVCSLQFATSAYLARKGDLRTAIGIASLIFFTLYARGHEYHAVTLIPFFLFLFSEKKDRYHNWIFVSIVALFALPTTYPILYYVLGSEQNSIAAYKATSPLLGWAFVVQRPLAVLALWLYVVWVEMKLNSSRIDTETQPN